MNIALIGLGLIGGSLAKALKQYTPHTVWGYDIDATVMQDARYSGAIDGPALEHLPEVDLLFAALYPQASVRFLEAHAGQLGSGATVIDLCGVKRYVCTEAARIFADSGVTFIGGHPMAGREASGFAAAQADLFQNASMILTPTDELPTAQLDELRAFFQAVGFRDVTLSTPEQHDRIIAYTSQLAHVVSSAYVLSPFASAHMGFSAGSFRDLTRVAKLNETMWTELFLENEDYLVEELDQIILNLQEYRTLIANHDREALNARLRTGSERKKNLES